MDYTAQLFSEYGVHFQDFLPVTPVYSTFTDDKWLNHSQAESDSIFIKMLRSLTVFVVLPKINFITSHIFVWNHFVILSTKRKWTAWWFFKMHEMFAVYIIPSHDKFN